jgi:hypothetical protein
MRTITEEDVQKFVLWVNSQDLDLSTKPEEFGYDNPVVILIDAVLSINRQYRVFVQPRVTLFLKEYSDLRSLSALKGLIVEDGYAGFCNRWNYQHEDRVRLLDQLTEFFIQWKEEHGSGSDMEAMKQWAATGSKLPVRGIAFTTTQYLRKLIGVSTVKPDVHMHRATYDALHRNLSNQEVVAVVEKAALILGVSATALDHGIWKLYAK